MNTGFRTRFKMLDGSLSALLAGRAPPARVTLRHLADIKGQVGQLRALGVIVRR